MGFALYATCAMSDVKARQVENEEYSLTLDEARKLSRIANERTFTMPSGMTREQRREWAAHNRG